MTIKVALAGAGFRSVIDSRLPDEPRGYDERAVAKAAGLGPRINTVMQPCFFALAGVLPADRAIALVKDSRGARLKGKEDDLFTGEYWAGEKSVALGLADKIGDLRSTLRERYGEKVLTVRDGLPKFKDFPKEFGGSGEMLAE